MAAKKPTVFNIFMKTTLSKVKAEHPELKHTEAFGKAAALWANAEENPKNK
ncbi:hypothetical protein [Spiroplasma endosymbiont of Apeira syringaria]|uniref:hypothetical protein n=1 Tax=Spiroplasma endosymbiont of Apeira syringaria TaxID=3066307 RepID=UPI0030D23D96